jgi:hypothetical protein
MLVWNQIGKHHPFYFYAYFEGSPPPEEPSAFMLRELPQFHIFPSSHGNISFLPNRKEARK